MNILSVKYLLYCFVFVITVLAGAQSTAPPDSFLINEYQVTDHHRFEENVMSGHWGHHLPHLVRTETQGLWFADDSGNDVNKTPKVRYYQFDGDSIWALRKEITNLGTVQQNTATLAAGDTLFSYGIDIANKKLTENYLDTRTLDGSAHYIADLEANTNYIGAALSPSGKRIVWWTNVVNGNGPCSWFYIWYDGQNWSPVIESIIEGANDFSYVMVAFLDDSTFYAAGEAIGGYLPNWTYRLAAAKIVLGHPISEFTILPGNNYTSCDIWTNPSNGDIHLLGNGQRANVTYYYKPKDQPWPQEADSIADPAVLYRGTRFIELPGGVLYLIMSTPTGLKFKYIPKDKYVGKIPFDSLTNYDIHNNPGFNFIFAVFPGRKEFQTAAIQGINFAYPGNDYDYCNIIKHIRIEKYDPTPVNDHSLQNNPQKFYLKQNYPNPFNPFTTISYSLNKSSDVKLIIYNVLGEQVKMLVDGFQSAAENYSFVWRGTDDVGNEMPSGVYFAVLKAGNLQKTIKILKMK